MPLRIPPFYTAAQAEELRRRHIRQTGFARCRGALVRLLRESGDEVEVAAVVVAGQGEPFAVSWAELEYTDVALVAPGDNAYWATKG